MILAYFREFCKGQKRRSAGVSAVARASRPLWRERPALADGAGRMPTPQRAGRPRYNIHTHATPITPTVRFI